MAASFGLTGSKGRPLCSAGALRRRRAVCDNDSMTSQIPPPVPEPAPVERLTYSVEESATALGVSKPTIYRLLARRILRPVPGLRHKRIPCQQIRRLGSGESLHGVN